MSNWTAFWKGFFSELGKPYMLWTAAALAAGNIALALLS